MTWFVESYFDSEKPVTFSVTFLITNSQAPIHDFFIRDVADYLSRHVVTTLVVQKGTWDEREAKLDAGEIDMGWICGAPYVEKIARGVPLKILAAPVMQHPRYQNRAIYFSDVVVRADSNFRTFEDLRGTRWAYNEKNSHSGYHIVRYFMATHNLDGNFFGRALESGAHQNSIEMILGGEVDAAAIDSTVLEMMFANNSSLYTRLRVIETLGPSPMPPFVVGAHVPSEIRAQIQNALIIMHETEQGRRILARAQMARFAAVSDADYDAIREMLRVAHQIQF